MSTTNKTTFWLLFCSVIIIEFLLFHTYVLREIVDFYPSSFDQSGYLSTAYQLYEKLMSHGLLHFNLIKAAFSPPSISFLSQTTLFFLFVGASRFSALLFGFTCFVLLQWMLMNTILFLTRHYSIALLFLGLVLSTGVLFSIPGGMIDFRIDFTAFCLYGIFVCSILRSKVFLDTQWTIVSALLACWLMLTRSISIIYVAEIIFFITLYYCSLYYQSRIEIKKHLKNIGLFSITTLVIVVPFLWILHDKIYNYYIIGHIIGEENHIRMAEVGNTTLLSNIFYYPISILMNHLGKATLCLLVVLFLVTIIQKFRQKTHTQTNDYSPFFLNFKYNIIFLTIAFLVPLITLSFDTVKSPVVGGIVIIPLLWIILFGFIFFCHSLTGKFFKFLAIFFLLAGLFNWVHHFSRDLDTYRENKNGQITQMYLDIGDYAQKSHWKHFTFSSDQIIDYLMIGDLNSLYYEQRGVLLDNSPTPLGGAIFAINQQDAINALNNSDVFIMNMGKYPTSISSVFPYNKTIAPLRPELKAIADKQLMTLGNYHFHSSTYRVYVRQ